MQPDQKNIPCPAEFKNSPQREAIAALLEAAREGNAILRSWFEKVKQGHDIGIVEKTAHFTDIGFSDVLTEADKASEAAVISRLRQCHDIPVCAEETGESVPNKDLPDGSRRWLIDPLDGTFNFKNGKADFSITIALQEKRDGKWETLVGAVSLPIDDEIYLADEKGSYLIGGKGFKKLAIEAKEVEAFTTNIDEVIKGKKIESVIYCKTPEKKQRWLDLREWMFERLGESGIDSFSSAMMIARMPENHRDAVILAGSALDFDWDTKAALHIAEKAGAKFKQTEVDGEPCLIVANSTSLLHALDRMISQEMGKLRERN